MSAVKVESWSDEGLSFPWARGSDDVLVAARPRDTQRHVEWKIHQLVIEIRLRPEEDGGFSVHVPELPGVVSQGETEEETEENIREALLAVIESYHKDREPVPWQRTSTAPQPGEIARWIVVHV